ncbi:acyltransferase [Salinispirillum marinum]|uniref:Acyltransferase n=2 Tax=Saccharospirillaceae TaxID=255527 RepID=A0ABV8BI52_9GAMM
MKYAVLGCLVSFFMLLNTLLGIGPLLFFAILKLIIPVPAFRRRCALIILWIAETWAETNKRIFALCTKTQWKVHGSANLGKDTSYLIVANHQSWVDIPALIQVLNRRVPYYKFFLKQELIWVPLLGLAWWGLDYPFMKRYSKEHIARYPHLAGKDMEITRRACEKFRGIPVSIINFAEGTRYTAAKHQAQNSPYKHLLRPKAGGIAFVLEAMGDQIGALLDITIHYPEGVPTFWQLVSGQITEVSVHLREYPITDAWVRGGYQTDPEYRARFQQWVSDLWANKDALLCELDHTAQQ